jgi:hypothetical protein
MIAVKTRNRKRNVADSKNCGSMITEKDRKKNVSESKNQYDHFKNRNRKKTWQFQIANMIAIIICQRELFILQKNVKCDLPYSIYFGLFQSTKKQN